MTIGVIALFIAIGQFSIRGLFTTQDSREILAHCALLILFIILVLGAWLYAPSSYSITDSNLIVHRPIKDVTILLDDIAEVRTVEPGELKNAIRTFGNGGFFGFYGKFYNSNMGHMTWYASQLKNRILITMKNGKKIVITPDDMSMLEMLSPKVKV